MINEEQPKQEAKTADLKRESSILTDFYKWVDVKGYAKALSEGSEDIKALIEHAKQQYQQEIIEKLMEERNYRSVPDQYVIDSIIEIIQSTK